MKRSSLRVQKLRSSQKKKQNVHARWLIDKQRLIEYQARLFYKKMRWRHGDFVSGICVNEIAEPGLSIRCLKNTLLYTVMSCNHTPDREFQVPSRFVRFNATCHSLIKIWKDIEKVKRRTHQLVIAPEHAPRMFRDVLRPFSCHLFS